MTNHLHLVAIPDTEPALGRTLRHVHGRFAQYWNTEAKTVGHMWQYRYYSCPMEPARVWSVIRYVELNPVRAGLVDHALDYPGRAPSRIAPATTPAPFSTSPGGSRIGLKATGAEPCAWAASVHLSMRSRRQPTLAVLSGVPVSSRGWSNGSDVVWRLKPTDAREKNRFVKVPFTL
jgi:hypothetical protein